jgi:hypothetical protein
MARERTACSRKAARYAVREAAQKAECRQVSCKDAQLQSSESTRDASNQGRGWSNVEGCPELGSGEPAGELW